jgi:predicted NUDIX family NTP pyrophosphohydrolase
MKRSAGILLYNIVDGELRVLLVHPGGPLWAGKDAGVWSIPKGEFEDEEPLQAAKREFLEETGVEIEGDFVPLSPIRQKSGKMVYAWASEGYIDPSLVKSNTFEMEWPPKSGKKASFPEIDRAEWLSARKAVKKINPAQVALINELLHKLGLPPAS